VAGWRNLFITPKSIFLVTDNEINYKIFSGGVWHFTFFLDNIYIVIYLFIIHIYYRLCIVIFTCC